MQQYSFVIYSGSFTNCLRFFFLHKFMTGSPTKYLGFTVGFESKKFVKNSWGAPGTFLSSIEPEHGIRFSWNFCPIVHGIFSAFGCILVFFFFLMEITNFRRKYSKKNHSRRVGKTVVMAPISPKIDSKFSSNFSNLLMLHRFSKKIIFHYAFFLFNHTGVFFSSKQESRRFDRKLRILNRLRVHRIGFTCYALLGPRSLGLLNAGYRKVMAIWWKTMQLLLPT